MSFKFFRKHQKVMLWIVVVITIFTFSLFSVTSTMRACFKSGDSAIDSFVRFTSMDGSDVEIDERDYYAGVDLLRKFTGVQSREALRDEDVFTHLILRHEAEAAGIRVSNAEISASLKAMGLAGSKEDYFSLLKQLHFDSPTKFEEGLRELMMVNKYRTFLTLTEDLITSEDIYEEYKLEHEEFQLSYAAFPYENYGMDITPESIDGDALTAWYEELRDSSTEVRDHFSEAEKFEFDVAYLDLQETNYDDYADLIETMEITVEPTEVDRYYDLIKNPRFVIETEEAEPEGEDASTESPEDDGGEEDAEPAEPTVVYVEKNEIQTQLEQELKLTKLVEKANSDWVTYARDNGLIGKSAEDLAKERAEKAAEKAAKEAEEAEAAEEEADAETESAEPEEATDGADEPSIEETEEEETPDMYFASLIEKYRLKQDRIEGPVSLDDLDKVPTYGSEMFKVRSRSLKENNARYMAPDQDHPYRAFFIRVTERVERRKKALEEVRESAVEQYIKKERRGLADAAARDFVNALQAKARELPEVKETIAQWEADAKQRAHDSVKVGEEVTEEALTQLRESAEQREMGRLQGDINTLLQAEYYAFFDEVAAEMELPVSVIEHYSKSTVRDPEFYKQDDSPEKFIKGNRQIFNLDTNGVTNPLNDRQTESWYLVRVLDRRFPPASSLSEADFESARRSMEQQRLMELQYPQLRQGAPAEEKEDPFAWDKMVETYNMRFPKQPAAPAEEDAAPSEEENS